MNPWRPEQHVVANLVAAWGFDVEDFAINIAEQCDLFSALDLDDGLLTVRRISSGEERLYTMGGHSAWAGALTMDLASGTFGPPCANGANTQPTLRRTNAPSAS